MPGSRDSPSSYPTKTPLSLSLSAWWREESVSLILKNDQAKLYFGSSPTTVVKSDVRDTKTIYFRFAAEESESTDTLKSPSVEPTLITQRIEYKPTKLGVQVRILLRVRNM